MPKIYSVVEIHYRTWGMIVGALAFFISLSMVLGVLLPIERSKRREAEDTQERLTMHAHRLAQAKLELQNRLKEEIERRETIEVVLNQTQNEMTGLQNKLALQENELKTIRAASAQPANSIIEMLPQHKGNGVELGKVTVGR